MSTLKVTVDSFYVNKEAALEAADALAALIERALDDSDPDDPGVPTVELEEALGDYREARDAQ